MLRRKVHVQWKSLDDKESMLPQDQKPQWAWAGVLAALFYIATSSSMAFINKTVMTTYKFKFPFCIMALQMLVSVLVLKALHYKNLIPYTRFTLTSGKSLLAPSLLYGVHSATALIAVDGLTMPMYTAIKRCTPLVIIILSVLVLRKPLPSTQICISVFLLTSGCVIAGVGDLAFDKHAYLYGTVSVIAQALFLLLVQEAGEKSMSASCILYHNSLITLPFFCVGIFVMQEFKAVKEYQGFTDVGFIGCFTFQILIGGVLNYSMFLCTTLNSALTTSITGVIKSFLQTFLGFFAFGGVRYHPLNLLGIFLNFYGGIMYAFSKYKEKSVAPATAHIQAKENGQCTCNA